MTVHYVGAPPLTWPRRQPMSPRSSPMRTRKIVSAALLVAALAVGTAACGSMNADKDKMEQT